MPSIKELYEKLQDVKIDADSINVNTDGLESLLSTVQADIALIKADIANGVLCDVRDGSGNAITSTVSGAKRSLDVTASVSFPSSLDTNTRDGSGNAITSTVFGSARRLDVNLSSAGTVGSTAPTSANLYGGSDGTNLRAVSVDSSGRANVNVNGTVTTSDRGTTGEATVTSFTSTTSATLKASNSSRKILTIYNEGAGNLHILYGSGTASTTNYSVKLATGDYLEVPQYTGQLTAIFASAGTARVTEIT